MPRTPVKYVLGESERHDNVSKNRYATLSSEDDDDDDKDDESQTGEDQSTEFEVLPKFIQCM